MSQSAAYCPSCNKVLAGAVAGDRCAECGARLTVLTDQLAETVDLSSPTQQIEPAPVPVGQAAAGLEHLIGRALDVYRCEALLGRGGMGHVFAALHEGLHRRCALKILTPKAQRDRDYVERFQHEGRAAAALVHPNITTIHAIGQAEGYHYLEMEFLSGGTLQELVRRSPRLGVVRATVLAAQIARGLAAAHCEQIVHRDLKPENVLLSSVGVAKIADFGLAKRVVARDDSSGFAMAGTPNYMAPELFRGAPPSEASDVYALGVTYYVLLTGTIPFAAATLPELVQTVQQQPLPVPSHHRHDLSPDVIKLLRDMLAKDPADRLPDAGSASLRLNSLLGGMRDIETLLHEAFEYRRDVRWRRVDDSYWLRVPLPDGRSQEVILQLTESGDGSHERLLTIYSLCCEADPQFYESALRLNSTMSHGGMAIREIDGRQMFCVADTYPRATVDAAEIRLSSLEVARQADAIENLLTGRDVM